MTDEPDPEAEPQPDPEPDPEAGSAHRVPIEPELDLHMFAPSDIASVVDEYIRAAHDAGLRALRLVHGRGRGVQRANVQSALDRHPLVESFHDDTASHLGATLCQLRD